MQWKSASAYIPENKIRDLLTYRALILAIGHALTDYSTERSTAWQILRVKRPWSGQATGWFATMPVIAGKFMAVKTVTLPRQCGFGFTHMAMIELLTALPAGLLP